ncbi:MAG: rhamnulokinase, partial [Clostridia bacterium]|nr:rhamnulokinase [Clostridia bacterium]
MKKRVLAFDFGASSGRAILGIFDGEKIELKEVHRFSNDPVSVNGTVYWDVLRLFYEIKQGILKAKECGGFESIGIDTWGVDFGLLDLDGRLLENPVHYRDLRTK